MCHVCGFICYLCVELKLMINIRSLSNQALKSAHPSRLSSGCWPWGVFIGAGQPLQHGEVRDTNLAWVRPVPETTQSAHHTSNGPAELCVKAYNTRKVLYDILGSPQSRDLGHYNLEFLVVVRNLEIGMRLVSPPDGHSENHDWRSVSHVCQLPRQLAAFETYLMAHYDTGIFTDV